MFILKKKYFLIIESIKDLDLKNINLILFIETKTKMKILQIYSSLEKGVN